MTHSTIDSIIPEGQIGTRNISEVLPLPNLRYFKKLDGTAELQQLHAIRTNDNIKHEWSAVQIAIEQEPVVEGPAVAEAVPA